MALTQPEVFARVLASAGGYFPVPPQSSGLVDAPVTRTRAWPGAKKEKKMAEWKGSGARLQVAACAGRDRRWVAQVRCGLRRLREPRNPAGQSRTPRVAVLDTPERLPAPPGGDWSRAGCGNNAFALGGFWVCGGPPPNPSRTVLGLLGPALGGLKGRDYPRGGRWGWGRWRRESPLPAPRPKS